MLHTKELLSQRGQHSHLAIAWLFRRLGNGVCRCCLPGRHRFRGSDTHQSGNNQDKSSSNQAHDYSEIGVKWSADSSTPSKTHVRHPPYPHRNVYAWTDSEVLLGWLRGDPRRFKVFVGKRVSEILELTLPKAWRHVAGKDNPADCATRGLYPSQLASHTQ